MHYNIRIKPPPTEAQFCM